MTEAPTSTSEPPNGGTSSAAKTSIELWKFFEERGGKLKESMFSVVTWIVGFAAVVLGFAVKEGFKKASLTSVEAPAFVASLGVIGLLLLALAVLVIRDYGRHINRTFARADAARDGESSAKAIWEAGKRGEEQGLPPVCRHLLAVVSLFSVGFALLVVLALAAWRCNR
jgi:hypothetical protein